MPVSFEVSRLSKTKSGTFSANRSFRAEAKPGRLRGGDSASRTNGKLQKKSRVRPGAREESTKSKSVRLFVLDNGTGQLDGDGVDTADAVLVVVNADVDQIIAAAGLLNGFVLQGREGGIAQVHAGEEAGDGGFSLDVVLDDGEAALDIADHGIQGDGGEEVRAHADEGGHAVVGGDASAAGDDSGGDNSAKAKNHLFHLRKDLSF